MANPVPAAIGALTTATLPGVVPNSGTQLLQALGNAPALMAQQQLQTMVPQEQVRSLSQQRLSQLAQAASTNQALLQNPQWQQQVQQLSNAAGIPLSRGADGAIDVRPMLPPIPDELRIKGLGLPGEARQTLWRGYNYGDQDLHAPIVTALNPAMVDAAYRSADEAVMRLGAGMISPDEYQAVIKGHSGTLGDTVAGYYLDPTVLQNSLSKAAQAKIADMQARGIHIVNEDDFRTKMLQYNMDKFGLQFGEKKRVDDARIQHEQAQDALAVQRLNIQTARLQQSAELQPYRIKHLQDIITGGSPAAVKAATAPVVATYQRLQSQYNANVQAINLNPGNATTSTGGQPSLADTTAKLQEQIDALRPVYEQAVEAQANVATGAARTVLGPKAVRPVYHAPVATKVKGGVTYYQYPDGTWDKTPPSGTP